MKAKIRKFFTEHLYDQSFLKPLTLLYIGIQPIPVLILVDILKPDWKEPGINTYIKLFLSNRVLVLFSPFFVFSMICALLFAFRPKRFAHELMIRLGIYTGTILSVIFTLVGFVSLPAENSSFLPVLGLTLLDLIPAFIAFGALTLIYRKVIAIKKIKYPGFATFIIYIIFLAILFLPYVHSVNQIFAYFIIGYLMAIPFLTILAGVILVANVKRYKKSYSPLLINIAGSVYALLFGTTTYVAIQRIFYLYSRLPPNPPNCYIATAAANGHVIITKGSNDQVITLKAGELVLQAVFPSFHQLLRKHYDNYGRRFANTLTNPFMADIVYILLMPITLATKMVLFVVVPDYKQLVDKR